jgi:hypothetical protein
MFGNNLLGDVVELGLAVYVIDAVTGKRKKVYVKNEAEKKRLLARNRELRAKLSKRKPIAKKTAKHRKSTKKKLWWE